MDALPPEHVQIIIKLRKTGLSLAAIQRATGSKRDTIRKYLRNYALEGNSLEEQGCNCNPGVYFLGCSNDNCPYDDTKKIDVGRGWVPVSLHVENLSDKNKVSSFVEIKREEGGDTL